MAYRFDKDEPVDDAILRCGREQLDRAILELREGVASDPTDAIHDARKAIKKERSLLRLARGAMPPEQRRRANATLRLAARRLSDARDADVMITSTDGLSERFAGQLPASAFDAVREHLEARRAAAHGHGRGRGVDERVPRELEATRARTDDWQFRAGGWEAIESRLLRSYERGRRAFARARVSGKTADLHAWRKRVKDLCYHERLLAPTCGPTVRGHVKELDRLADLLGDDHDLAVLGHELTRDGTQVAADLGAVLGLIDHRRTELQSEAAHVGARAYAETPKAFRRRMRGSWSAGRALARTPREQHPAELAAATR